MSSTKPELRVLEKGLGTFNDAGNQDKCFDYCTTCVDYSTYCLNIAKKCHLTFAIPRDSGLHRARELSFKLILASNFTLLFRGKVGNICYFILLFITAAILFALALYPFVVETNKGHMSTVTAVKMALSLLILVLVVTDLAVKVWSVRRNKKGEKNAYDIKKSKDSELLKLIKLLAPDVLRLQTSELFLYAVVVCNIVSVASGRHYAENFGMAQLHEKYEFAGLIISLFLFVIHTVIINLIVIIKCVVSLERLRRGTGYIQVKQDASNNKKRSCHCISKYWGMFFDDKDNKNCKAAVRGFCLEILFVIHIILQILTQVFCLAAIWAKVTCENPLPTASVDLYISPFTWVIIVLGFVLPNKLLASLTFYVSVYVWASEYSLSLLSNVLNLLSKTSNYYKGVAKATYEMIDKKLGSNELHCCEKFMYPVLSPVLSIFSSLFYVILISFPIFMVVGVINPRQIDWIDPSYIFSNNLTSCYISFSWIIFCIVAIALIWCFNFVVITVGMWWVVIVPTLIISFVLIVVGAITVTLWGLFTFCLCIILVLVIANSNNRRQ